MQHLDKFNLIHQSQHGCHSGYSCSSNLLSFLESVSANVDAKLNVDTVYLYFAKAFDKVPHERLLRKLKAHGIDGIVCDWIASWLKDRWQRVCLEGITIQLETGLQRSTGLDPWPCLVFDIHQ